MSTQEYSGHIGDPEKTRDPEKMDQETGPFPDDSSSLEIRKPVGVRKIEIIGQQYGFKGKVFVYFCIFLVAYAYGLDGMVRTVFQTQATNSYSQHSLLATVNVIKAVVAAAAQPIYARLTDVFGRLNLLFVSILFYVVGTIIESQAYDVQRFAGGAILYQIGYTGLILILELIIGDFSFLNWRLVVSLVPGLPFIINTWISGNITDDLGTKWSWGIGMWAIIVPVACIPLAICLFHMTIRAHKSPEWEQFKHLKTDFQSLGAVNYLKSLFWKLDIVGVILMAAVLALLLIPLTLAGGVDAEWKKAKIIAPLVVGFCLIPAFILWEGWCPYPVTPFHLLKDRGVWAALCIGVCINFVWQMQGDYMYTVLMVAVNESSGSATRITSLYSFVSVIVGSILGLFVIKLRRVKMFIIFGGIIWLIAMSLLIRYRGGESSKAGIIGALVMLGFGAGFFTYPTQASMQSCTRHEHMAVMTSLYLAMYNIGTGFGGAVSGAIWTQLLPKEIAKRLSDPKLVQSAYGQPLTFIVDYAWGTPERMAVVAAYQHVQRILLITGTCLCVPLIVLTFLIRDHKLDAVQSLENAESESQKSTGSSWKTKFIPNFKP